MASMTSNPLAPGIWMSRKTRSGSQPPDRVDRLGAGGALGDDLQPLFRCEQRAQPLAGERLVVGDEDAHLPVRHATWNAASPGGAGA